MSNEDTFYTALRFTRSNIGDIRFKVEYDDKKNLHSLTIGRHIYLVNQDRFETTGDAREHMFNQALQGLAFIGLQVIAKEIEEESKEES